MSHLPTHASRLAVLRALIDAEKLFKQTTRIDHSWNVLKLPHYLPSHFESEVSVDYRDCGKALRELPKFAVNTTIDSVLEVRQEMCFTNIKKRGLGVNVGMAKFLYPQPATACYF